MLLLYMHVFVYDKLYVNLIIYQDQTCKEIMRLYQNHGIVRALVFISEPRNSQGNGILYQNHGIVSAQTLQLVFCQFSVISVTSKPYTHFTYATLPAISLSVLTPSHLPHTNILLPIKPNGQLDTAVSSAGVFGHVMLSVVSRGHNFTGSGVTLRPSSMLVAVTPQTSRGLDRHGVHVC